MPRYVLRCLDCKQEYETTCSFTKLDDAVCPECQSKQKQQIFTPVNFQIKNTNSSDCGCPHSFSCPHAQSCKTH